MEPFVDPYCEPRAPQLQTLCAKLGFSSFDPERSYGFASEWGFLYWLSQGENRYAFNILRGIYHDQTLFVFDHHYETGSDQNREHRHGTILMFVEKEVFPPVKIIRENLKEKLSAAFGIGSQIQFESAEFSRLYHVHSTDKKFAYDVCNPPMMDYLLANCDLQVEINGPAISIAFEMLLPVDQIEFNLQRLVQIRSLMPDYLFTQTT